MALAVLGHVYISQVVATSSGSGRAPGQRQKGLRPGPTGWHCKSLRVFAQALPDDAHFFAFRAAVMDFDDVMCPCESPSVVVKQRSERAPLPD